MLPGWTRGLSGGQAFPDSASTGPAAWPGYTGSLTPVTGQLYEIEAGAEGSWPAWVTNLGGGSALVTGMAFGAGTTLYVTAPSVTFTGCTILAEIGTTAAINYPSPGSTVAAGSNGGTISTIATWTHPSAHTLDVANGTQFPSGGGAVTVAASGATTAVVNFTGVSGNSLTGCTYVSGAPAPATVATSNAVSLTSGGLTVQYCTISGQDGSSANRVHCCVDGDTTNSSITIDHCNFYWFEQAVHAANSTLITNSYLHDPVYQGADHTECIEMPAGSTLIADNCTLLNPLTQTAVIAASSPPASFSVTNSLLGGGGYVFYTYTAATDIVVENNCITTAYFPGGGYSGSGLMDNAPTWGGSNQWSGNTWYDGQSAGQTIPEPS